MSLWEFLKEKMSENPSREICENDAKMTYEQTIVFAENFAKKIKANKVKCCGILCKSEMAAALAVLACLAADVTVLPLSTRYGQNHCKRILEQIGPDFVITDPDGSFRLNKIADSSYEAPENPPALIMCTSGTSGKPKGAMLSNTNILTNIKDISEYFKIDRQDSILIARPLYHCAVLTGEFFSSIAKGLEISFYSGEFNPIKILGLIKKYGITVFCATPTILGMMARFEGRVGAKSLKKICVSGEGLDQTTGKGIAEAFPDADIYHVYGLTEASPRVSYLPPELFGRYTDCVGFPLKSVHIKILSKNGKPVGKNETGMLWIKGPSIMQGYYGRSTDSIFKNGWLCTGDLAVINDAGLLKIKGRSDGLINKAGINIYPQEIETALKSDKRVEEVVAFGKDQKDRTTEIHINISGNFKKEGEVWELCKQRLSPYQMPSRISLLKRLEKNGSGKIIRGDYDV